VLYGVHVFCYNVGMDSPWAHTMRARYSLTIGGIIFLIVAGYVAVRTYEPPSCTDGLQNQDEAGVDCGGSCVDVCASQVEELHVAWAQLFEVSPGWWSALAYVENPNVGMRAERIPYRFTVYDRAGAYVLEQRGFTFINNEPIVPVFIGRLNAGSRDPHRVTFEWLDSPRWKKSGAAPLVVIEEQSLHVSETVQNLEAVVRNTEPRALHATEVVAIVYDGRENAMATSKTIIDTIAPRAKQHITFSWPRPFEAAVGRVELLPRVPTQE